MWNVYVYTYVSQNHWTSTVLVITAIDLTKFLTNDNEYTLIDAADLDKHIIWTLNDDGNRNEGNSVKLEKASLQDQLVINDSVLKKRISNG